MHKSLLLPLLLLTLLPATLRAAIGFTDIRHCSAPGTADGQLTITAEGNAGPFDFSWSTGHSTSGAYQSTAQQLAPGFYSVTVTFANGDCSVVHSTWIHSCTGPIGGEGIIEVSNSTVTQCSAPGVKDGAIQIDVTNTTGVEPLYYNWYKNGLLFAFTQDISGLTPGTYTVRISNGCMVEHEATFQVYDCNSELTWSATIQALETVACEYGVTDIGDLQAVTSGNPFTPMQYQWSGPNGFTGNTETLREALAPGWYYLTVTDPCGRQKTASYELKCCFIASNRSAPQFEPAPAAAADSLRFTVFPNPFLDDIHIVASKLPAHSAPLTLLLELSDITGRVVGQGSFTLGAEPVYWNLRPYRLPPGAYILSIQSDTNTNLRTKVRLVKAE